MQSVDYKKIVYVSFIVVLGLVLRLYFLSYMPFTNDEGAYLYDGKTILTGSLPGGDVVTKSPVVILVFAIFTHITGGSIYSARLVSLFFGFATMIPLLSIVYACYGKNLIIATTIWLLFSAPIALMGFGHTEAVACFFAGATIALAVVGLQKKKVVWWAVFCGMSFALAFGSRKINLVLLVPLVILLLQNWKRNRTFGKFLGYFSLGGAIVVLIFGVAIVKLYGFSGLNELLGGGYAHIVSSRISGDASVDVWGISTFDTIKILSRIATAQVVMVLLVVAMFFYKLFKNKKIYFSSFHIVFASWVLSQCVFYAIWPTFLPDYAADFLVPIILLSVWVISKIWEQQIFLVKLLFIVCFGFLNVLSYVSIFSAPWTGMFTAQASEKMADVMKNIVPKDDSVLTAATIIPYLSGHKTLFNISHPLWYRYEFISVGEKSIFLPSWDQVSSAIKNGEVKWILMEHLTDYAYFRNTDQLISEIGEKWELVDSVPNNTGFRSNTLKLYRRK
jgi:4-amino-4-deoxy-L-arabinose transferase-like glycosyltransferase